MDGHPRLDLDFTEDELHRYSRHILLGEVGATGQARLRQARVLVVDNDASGSGRERVEAAALAAADPRDGAGPVTVDYVVEATPGIASARNRALAESGVRRDDVFVTTKCPPDNAGKELDTLRKSLELMQLDHVDLWLIHWPGNGSVNTDLWKAFIEARDAGLTKEIGVSNFDANLLDEVMEATGEAPAINQIRWSPLLFDPQTVGDHRDRGIALEGYRGHADGGESSEFFLEWGVTGFTLFKAQAPAIVVDRDGHMVGVLQRRRAAIIGGVVEVPAWRGGLPDELGEVMGVLRIALAATLGCEVELVPPLQLGRRGQRRRTHGRGSRGCRSGGAGCTR